MKSRNTIARAFGIFFLLSFLFYAVGSSLTALVTESSDLLGKVNSDPEILIFGVLLMAIFHSIFNIALPSLMMPIFKPFNKVLSYAYFGGVLVSTVTLMVGTLFLLLLIPLGKLCHTAELVDQQSFEALGVLLIKGNFYAYQVGMAIWGFTGFLLSYLLIVSKLVPRALSIWGGVGYLVFTCGTILELFGLPFGLQLSLPAGLFEITLSIWFIAKGFRSKK